MATIKISIDWDKICCKTCTSFKESAISANTGDCKNDNVIIEVFNGENAETSVTFDANFGCKYHSVLHEPNKPI